jgi:hypothetical protein
MDRELAVVLGMSISYVASLAGMFIAMWAYKRNTRRRPRVPPVKSQDPPDDGETGGSN